MVSMSSWIPNARSSALATTDIFDLRGLDLRDEDCFSIVGIAPVTRLSISPATCPFGSLRAY
jgi:hypothetical protein